MEFKSEEENQMRLNVFRTSTGRILAILALAASLLTIGLLSVNAQETDPPEPTLINEPAPVAEEQLTKLTVEGAASRNVSYDGTVGRFTISVLKPTVLEAVSSGNTAAKAIADAVAEDCVTEEPEDTEDAEDSDEPTCVSPGGLQTTRIRIHEEYDWTEQGRVSQGFRYENGLSIAIQGTDFAGGLVDLVIKAGGDNVRFDGLDFTASGRAEAERLALLDAIDDAQATANAIADHMGYEIVRIVELSPQGSLTANRVYEETAQETADSAYEPTPVFGGSESITSRVRMIFELRPLPPADESIEDSNGN